MKPAHYYDKFWRQNFYFFLGWEESYFNGYLNKFYNITYNINGIDGLCCQVINDEQGKDIICIWTKNKPTNPESISVLAHECLHAVNRCLDDRKYKLDLNNDEAQAYFLTAILRNALESFRKKKKEKKK